MAQPTLPKSLRSVLKTIDVQSLRTVSDGKLLCRYVDTGVEDAFRVITERHGPMVLGVCARVLHCPHDADDAFQATFLVFAQRAASIRKSASLANWLYGVARRVAAKLHRQQRRRQQREQAIHAVSPADSTEALTWADVKTGLDEELQRLPAAYRDVLILCYLEGQSRDEAARCLDVNVNVVKGRLERARKLLAQRLTQRGLSLSVGLLAVALAPDRLSATVHAAALLRRQDAINDLVAPQVMSLANQILKGTAMNTAKRIGVGILCALLVATGIGFTLAQAPDANGPLGETERASKQQRFDSDNNNGGPGVRAQTPTAKRNRFTLGKSQQGGNNDEAFIRRVSLDLRGVPPTLAEIHFFLQRRFPQGRNHLTFFSP